MKTDFPIDLMDYATLPGHHAWIGRFAPFNWNSLDLGHGTNFRASSVHHQRYDVVWLYEFAFDQGNLSRLELLLDEMVRLLKAGGTLVLRYEYSMVPAVKRFLSRRHGCSAEVEQEWRSAGEIISAFRIRRELMECYRDPRWTFAVLTTGNREPEVVKFLQSIRERPEGAAQEIIVCGPRSSSYDAFGVTYLDRTYRADVAEIAKKKNDIAALARHPNLLIAHDRYALNPDFFEGFARFGYDFDFVTIRQWFDTGEEFPSYCALQRGDLTMTTVRMLRRYDALYPGHFINGGLFAVKTHVCRALPLNPMLYWEQAEDVEFSQALRDQALPPRINCFSSAETRLTGTRLHVTRTGYRIGLEPLPDEVTTFPPPAPPAPPAPPEPEVPPPPDPPQPEPAPPPAPRPGIRALRRGVVLAERGLGKLIGPTRAARIVRRSLQRKKLTAAWGILVLLHLASLLMLLLIAARMFL